MVHDVEATVTDDYVQRMIRLDCDLLCTKGVLLMYRGIMVNRVCDISFVERVECL